jgi:2'-hydroxyisoflavone reductase
MRRLLVLGGTGFLGHAVVQAALSDRPSGTPQWSVATFNRGLSGVVDPGVTAVRGDRYEPTSIDILADSGPWDVVIDCSGYVPRNVLSVAESLNQRTGRYVFISSVSAYAGWPSEPLTEESAVLQAPPDAGPDFGTDTEDGPTRYGYQKAGCEAAVQAVIGVRRAAILRPGVILGPREYVGRLIWWLRRFAEGGLLIGPGTPDRAIQPIDVRDVARFAITAAREELSGVYNVTAPIGAATFGGLLDACRDSTDSDAQVRWVPDEALLAAGVRQWSEMPLWRVSHGVWAVDSSRAALNGLECRPLPHTVADTWAWMQSGALIDGRDRSHEVGLSREREADLLRRLAGVADEPRVDLSS